MRKFFISLLLIYYLLFSNTYALSNENVLNYTLKYEKIFDRYYDFSGVNQNLLNLVLSKINTYVNQIYFQELHYEENEAEIVLGQLLGLKKSIQKYIINVDTSKLTITVIDDKRCTNCSTDKIIEDLKNIIYFKGANFIKNDFSEDGISDYLKSNNIDYLPTIILSNDKFTDNISILSSLRKLNDGRFFYDIGGNFDPFKIVSDRGYFKLDFETLKQLKKYSLYVMKPKLKNFLDKIFGLSLSLLPTIL